MCCKYHLLKLGFQIWLWYDTANSISVNKVPNMVNFYDKTSCTERLVSGIIDDDNDECLSDVTIYFVGMLKWRHLVTNNEVMRWAIGASDVCFSKEWHAKFFALGRTIPVNRGEGVYQRSMDFILERLNAGSWIHTFPEGQ